MGNCYSQDKRLLKHQLASINFSNQIRKQLKNTVFNKHSCNLNSIKSNKEILSQYYFQMLIGSGLFSKVYLAENKGGKQVALKIINKKNFCSLKILQKFLIEKKVLEIVDHKNILKLFKTQQSKDKIYYELEYASRGNLLQFVNNSQNLTLQNVKEIIGQIASALFHLHQKDIIYGDLKAENVLINQQGILKLCDFNLSGTESLLQQEIQGTLSYISPEMINMQKMNKKSDFWALGVLAYLLYFKKYPFTGKNKIDVFFNIVNRVIEPGFSQAPTEFKLFILDIFQLDIKKRLGNNFQEFKNHILFKGFNWKKVCVENQFSYLNKMMDEEQKFSRSSFQDSNCNSEKHKSEFYYELNDFSFERTNDDILAKSTSHSPNYSFSKFQINQFIQL